MIFKQKCEIFSGFREDLLLFSVQHENKQNIFWFGRVGWKITSNLMTSALALGYYDYFSSSTMKIIVFYSLIPAPQTRYPSVSFMGVVA